MVADPDRKKIIIPILVAAVLFIEFLDASIINTAIPSIAKDFQQSPLSLKLSVASYFLSLAIFIPISGWCADKFGTKKVFLSSVACFGVSSLLCSLAQNSMQLTFFRFLQGIGGAFMNPVSRILVIRLFPPQDLLRIQGFIFTPSLMGLILGPFLGGILTTYLSWHWIFYINIPICMSVIYFALQHVDQNVDSSVKPFDYIGFALAALSLVGITVSVESLGHYEILSKKTIFALGFLGFFLFLGLIFYCSKVKNPILNFLILKIKTFRLGFFCNISLNLSNAAVTFMLPLMFQKQFNQSPAYSGTVVLPIAFAYVIFRSLSPKIIPKIGFKGCICLFLPLHFITLIMFANIRSLSLWYIIPAEFLYGVSGILVGASLGALIYMDIDKKSVSNATALDMTFRQFGASLGVGLSALVLTFFATYFDIALFHHTGGLKIFQATFYVLSIFPLIALLFALNLKSTDGVTS